MNKMSLETYIHTFFLFRRRSLELESVSDTRQLEEFVSMIIAGFYILFKAFIF